MNAAGTGTALGERTQMGLVLTWSFRVSTLRFFESTTLGNEDMKQECLEWEGR